MKMSPNCSSIQYRQFIFSSEQLALVHRFVPRDLSSEHLLRCFAILFKFFIHTSVFSSQALEREHTGVYSTESSFSFPNDIGIQK